MFTNIIYNLIKHHVNQGVSLVNKIVIKKLKM